MRTTIKATGIELTPALRDYVEKKMNALDKLVPSESLSAMLASVEIGQTTKHHKHGSIFRAEVNLSGAGMNMRAESEKNDLYKAVDDIKDEIVRDLSSRKDKNRALFKRGALAIKEIMKGIRKFPKFRK